MSQGKSTKPIPHIPRKTPQDRLPFNKSKIGPMVLCSSLRVFDFRTSRKYPNSNGAVTSNSATLGTKLHQLDHQEDPPSNYWGRRVPLELSRQFCTALAIGVHGIWQGHPQPPRKTLYYPKKTIGENVEARGSIGNVQGTGRGGHWRRKRSPEESQNQGHADSGLSQQLGNTWRSIQVLLVTGHTWEWLHPITFLQKPHWPTELCPLHRVGTEALFSCPTPELQTTKMMSC